MPSFQLPSLDFVEASHFLSVMDLLAGYGSEGDDAGQSVVKFTPLPLVNAAPPVPESFVDFYFVLAP